MEVHEVFSMARDLMNYHGLGHWILQLDRAKRRAGSCIYSKLTITLSHFYIQNNTPEEIKDTILHEIAHALTPHQKHNYIWRAKCIQIGAKPLRCYNSNVVMPKGNWRAKCLSCGKEFHKHRKPKYINGWMCPACGPNNGRLYYQKVNEGCCVQQ